MKFGLFLGTEYPARRSMTARVDALIEQVRLARDLGFDCALAGQHYLSYPLQILQPTPLLGAGSPQRPETCASARASSCCRCSIPWIWPSR